MCVGFLSFGLLTIGFWARLVKPAESICILFFEFDCQQGLLQIVSLRHILKQSLQGTIVSVLLVARAGNVFDVPIVIH